MTHPTDPEDPEMPDAGGGNADKADMDLFKTYLATAEKVSDRRGSANQWLLSINSAIVGLYGFLAQGKQVGTTDMMDIWRWAIPVAGIAVCLAWSSILANYRKLNAAKFTVLREMEQDLPLPVFQREKDAYDAEGRVDLSALEGIIPWIFGMLYAVFLISAFAA